MSPDDSLNDLLAAEAHNGVSRSRRRRSAHRESGDDREVHYVDISLPLEVVNVVTGPFRPEILYLLSRSPCDVNTLARVLDIHPSLVSYNLRVLFDLGLVSYTKQKTRHLYRIGRVVRIENGEDRLTIEVAITEAASLKLIIPILAHPYTASWLTSARKSRPVRD